MRRRGMLLEAAVQGAIRLAMLCSLLGTLLQVQADHVRPGKAQLVRRGARVRCGREAKGGGRT